MPSFKGGIVLTSTLFLLSLIVLFLVDLLYGRKVLLLCILFVAFMCVKSLEAKIMIAKWKNQKRKYPDKVIKTDIGDVSK